jgi:hypothetical protein
MNGDNNTPSHIRFLHNVGVSTLRQGMTIPISSQAGWAARIEKGQSIPITICFGDAQVQATLRRINNAVGHLQIRYESKTQATLREYLVREFAPRLLEKRGPLEVVETSERTFCFRPLPGDKDESPTLSIVAPLFHNLAEDEGKLLPQYASLADALAAITYQPTHGQREYNSRIAEALLERGWNREARLMPDLGLRVDFEKNGVWLEVEFGNARTYYQDYVKFALAHRLRSATCGILLCPTAPLASMLCDLGRKRAVGRLLPGRNKPPSYSGMMTYEKAARELPFLTFLLPGQVVVAGMQLSRNHAAL